MKDERPEKPMEDAAALYRQSLAERLPGGVGICSVYADGHVEKVYLNDTACALLGCACGQDEADTVFAAVQPDDRKKLVSQLAQAIKTDTPFAMDISVGQGKDRRRLHLRASVPEKTPEKATMFLLLNDVEEERQALQLAEECRQILRITAQSDNLSLWLYRPDTHACQRPFTGEGLLGLPNDLADGPEKMIADGAVYPEDAALFRDTYRQIDEGASHSECTVRIREERPAKYEWQHIVLTRQADEESDTPTVIGVSTNVELQKEAEIRYEREVRLRRELVKEAVIYYRINLSSRMVEELYSEAMDTESIALPIAMESLIAAGMFDSCYGPDRERLSRLLDPANMLENYEKGKSTETFEYRRYLPGKGLRWLKGSIAKLKRVSSDDVIAFFTAIDIDEEKKEQILYRDVMDEEIEGLITMQTDSRRLRILKENRPIPGVDLQHPAATELFYDGSIHNALLQDVAEEDMAGTFAFLDMKGLLQALEKQKVVQHTYCTRQPDGAVRRKKIRVFYLDESRQDVIFVRRDITDLYNEQQRQSAAIKRAMDEAEAANDAKSVFLSRMSHDMRTPLNAIIGYSGQVLRQGADEKQKDAFLDDIHAAGEYLLGIINDVLDMTKIESNKMVLHPEPYSCGAFRQSVETVIRPLCQNKGVELVLDFPKSFQRPVLLDKVRFNQIFVNILSNAVKFTPAGGRIVLKAVCTGRQEDKIQTEFTVADTGCGMSAAFLPHAFDSFSQEYRGQEMHSEQGTGLGLSIVKQLVELMGGSISVESTLGKGTTFTVKMPMSLAQEDNTALERAFPAEGLRGLHLLLCEDHPMNRKIALRLLEKEGCTVDTAENGQIGVQKFRDSAPNSYDAILMDVRMPVMTGLEAARAIRALPREDASAVPIIAMTANAFVEDRRECLEAGMNEHIAKPLDPLVMFRTIYRLTESRHIRPTPKVLVVDDIEMNAALVAKALAGSYETILALSGEEALEHLRQNPYIVAVITDVQMPGMDGGELIRTIRRNPAYNRVALVANTQYGDSHTEELLMRDGADDFLYKPTAPALILSRLENVLSKYR